MITYADARKLRDELQPEYQERHFQHAKLRDFWHGKYWNEVDTMAHGLGSIFRDITSVKPDVGPDMKLVRNLVFDVCLKYQSFLSGLPMIRTFVDRPDSRRARAQAATKERVLYATWEHANMNQQLNRIGWFGPLMGDSFLGIWPDFDYPCVKAVVRSPEYAFPVPSFDGMSVDAILFSWKTTEARAKRAFPNYRGGDNESTKEIEVLEYSDTTQFVRWVDAQQTNAVEHNLGFNLFDQVPFIHVPGEPWNHGAVEQSVGMVEAGNALYSLMMQAMIENVFPRLILEDPLKFSETIDTGPGATIGVNAGGKAMFLSPDPSILGSAVGLVQENERAVKQNTSMPDVNFGQFQASIITGKAVNALQGAGTGSVVEMVQGNGIGVALENWNQKALTIYQRMFPDDQILLYGMQPTSSYDLNPRQFAVNFKGSDIQGSPRNEVVFSPYIDMHGKLVIALQAQGAGLVSKEYGREQLGISDSEQMQEQITEEVIEDAVIGALVQALQADPEPQAADQAEAQVYAYLSGQPAAGSPAGAPAAPPPAPAPTGGGMPFATLPGGGQVGAPALNLPPGSTLAQAGAPPLGAAPQGAASTPAATGRPVTLMEAQQELAGVQLQGQAWLVGAIVQAKQTSGPIEVDVTDPADRQTIADTAPFPVMFHRVAGPPGEPHVQIGGQSAGTGNPEQP